MMQRSRSTRSHFHQAANNNCSNTNDMNVPIRTVYVAPIKSHMSTKVKGYFERYGAVEAVRFHSRDDYQFGFVQFKSADDAKTVLSIGSHRIASYNVKVKPADLWHQPEFQQPPNPLLVVPDQDSPSNILIALNDDCLREVFMYLQVKDLANAAETCVRFNKHAKDVFAKKYHELNLINEFRLQPNEMTSIINNFGASITSLKVNEHTIGSVADFMKLIAPNQRSCAVQLKTLEMDSFDIKGKLAKHLRPLFLPLERLHLLNCTLRGEAKNLLGACKNLKVLTFDNCDTGNSKCMKQKIGQLEEAVFDHNLDVKEDALRSFIKLNPTLKTLELTHNSLYWTYSSKLITEISENLPNLIELSISEEMGDSVQQIAAFGRLHSLKVLKIDFIGDPIAPLMKTLADNNVPIEHLEITEGEISNDAIESIAKMKKINCLKLESIEEDLTEDNLIQLAKELTELRELHLIDITLDMTIIGLKKMLTHAKKLSILKLSSIHSITIDVDDYKAMLKTVQSRPEKIKLAIEIESYGDKVNVPEEILVANRDTLFINETIEDDSIDSDDSYDDDHSEWSDYFYSDSDDYYMYHDSDADSENGYGMGYIGGDLFWMG